MAHKSLRAYFDQQPEHKRIIFPLNVPTVDEALYWVKLMSPHVGMFKVSFELQQRMIQSIARPATLPSENGRTLALRNVIKIYDLFELLADRIYYDCKFHARPNAVGSASKAVADMNVAMFNVHCSGDVESLQQAVANRGNAWVLGETVLTSITPERCQHIYGTDNIGQVLSFANMVVEAGADGITCSPHEIVEIRKNPEFNHLALIASGVCPIWAGRGDHKRVMTPYEAIRAGSEAVIINPSIRESDNPVQACGLVAVDIKAALAER